MSTSKPAPRKIRGVYEKVPGSDIWCIQYFDANGRRRREKAGTRGMAMDLLAKRRTEKLRGQKLPETLRARTVTIADLLDLAAEHVRTHYSTQRVAAKKKGGAALDYRHPSLASALGKQSAAAVTPQAVERVLSKLAVERAWEPASFNRYKAYLSLAYRLGVENGLVTINPARLVRQRHEDNARIRWLSSEEETRLRATVAAYYPNELPTLDLSLHTGMRRKEQYGLTWDCVDFARRQLTIPRSKHGGIRYIPLDDTAAAALGQLKQRGDGIGRVMVAAQGGHGYAKGHALAQPREWFGAACQRAAVANYTWHANRHTFISRLIMAGVPLRTVQELAGHKTIAMTCRYAHLAPEHQLDAVRVLDGWGRKSGKRSATRTATGGFGPKRTAVANHAKLLMNQAVS